MGRLEYLINGEHFRTQKVGSRLVKPASRTSRRCARTWRAASWAGAAPMASNTCRAWAVK